MGHALAKTACLLTVIAFGLTLLGAAPARAGYADSNAGIPNVQASTTPVTLACPAAAPWLRDPDVCASRWSPTANDKSESDLAIDPTNHDHLAGMSKFFFSPDDYLFRLGWYDSTDGGRTWTSGLLPGYDTWMDTTDPVVAFDAQGNLYSLVLPFNFQIEPNGGHNWGVGHAVPKGVNDGIYLSRSLVGDGAVGRVWREPTLLALYHGAGVGPTADKQWVGADAFGKHPGSVYASWISFDGVASDVAFSVSTDYGATFSPFQLVTRGITPKFNEDPYVFEGPEGNVYVSYDVLPPKQGGTTGSFAVLVSHDNGATFSGPGEAVPIVPGPTPFAPDTFRDGTPYTIAANPANGHLLAAYEVRDGATGRVGIWLRQSADEGRTWSGPVQVNDASAPGDTTQPKVFAAADGEFGVAFYDRQLACPATDPIPANVGKTNTCIDVTVQFYDEGGVPLGGNIRATQESWDPNVNPAKPGGLFGGLTFIGDYFGGAMVSEAGGAWAGLLFVSTSSALQANAVAGGNMAPPYQQQVYARVPVPA